MNIISYSCYIKCKFFFILIICLQVNGQIKKEQSNAATGMMKYNRSNNCLIKSDIDRKKEYSAAQ